LVHNFGEVAAGKKYNGEFKFTNTGEGLLKITDVEKCCGAVVTLDNKELSPGESGTLKVEYNTGRGSGSILRQLHVSSNDPANPKVTLTIRSQVVPKVACEPKRLKFALNKQDAGCPDITISSLDKQSFSIQSFQSTGGSITADIDSSVEATKFVLQPTVDFAKLRSFSAGFVSIRLTHPECDRVDVYFSTLLRFQFTPKSIILFNPDPQKPIVKKISVANNYGEDFEVESTSSQKGLAKIVSQQKTAKGYQFEVEVTPPPPDDTGKFDDVLYLHLKDDDKVPIKCYIRYISRESSS
jgi:hypothetical protein